MLLIVKYLIIAIGCFHLFFPVTAIKWGSWCYRFMGVNHIIWEDEGGNNINKGSIKKYRYIGAVIIIIGILLGVRY
ncbi:hypothetical protein KCTCHS21_37380 [Cohnella abietis]|uniref:Uncharacterized protein n=1 Tax=Cohnella abietis TaxID=2507935 RepID=A0A3T1D8D9_9BACL|nr:hypothetical protein KCTCHS21_37380 [Cohnella abietis]